MAALKRCPTSLTASLLKSTVSSSVVGMSARNIAGASCVIVSTRSFPVVSASRRWPRSISGVLTPTFGTQSPPALDPFVDDAGALLGYAGIGSATDEPQ